jgi:hypothetical protein
MGTKIASSTKKTDVQKVVKMKAGTATAAPKAKVSKAAKPSKFIGKTTGMRVQAFQDKLMKENYRAKLTDTDLASAMREEFPNAVAFNEKHVAGIRSQWSHGHRPSQEGTAPERALARFDDEGLAINPRARKAKTEKPAKKAKTKKVKPQVDETDDSDDDDNE